MLTSVLCSLNAPIPTGAAFGYHPGGWGKPPVDEFGRPIYGDVFGVTEVYHEVCVFGSNSLTLGLYFIATFLFSYAFGVYVAYK
jgi:hypothetical protein